MTRLAKRGFIYRFLKPRNAPNIDCKKNPFHSWCLTSYGKDCEKYKFYETVHLTEKEKKLIVDLHNQKRILVSQWYFVGLTLALQWDSVMIRRTQ